jgi:hypothetical protein
VQAKPLLFEAKRTKPWILDDLLRVSCYSEVIMIGHIGNYMFRTSIVVRDLGGRYIETKSWDNLTFELACKYKWYFTYRAALLQVKYPKHSVDLSIVKYIPDTRSDLEKIRKRWQNMVVFSKGKVTNVENKIALARKNWMKLFPIEDDLHYIKALKVLEQKKATLQDYIAKVDEIDELINNSTK